MLHNFTYKSRWVADDQTNNLKGNMLSVIVYVRVRWKFVKQLFMAISVIFKMLMKHIFLTEM